MFNEFSVLRNIKKPAQGKLGSQGLLLTKKISLLRFNCCLSIFLI